MDEFTEQTVIMLVLWSILRWERKVGLLALEQVGDRTDMLARGVDRVLNKTCAQICHQLGGHGFVVGYRTSLEPLLKAAEHEASLLGNDWVGTEHLLLAAIRSADKPLRNVLNRHRFCTRASVRR